MATDIVVRCKKCKKMMFKNFSVKTFCNDCGTELPEVKELKKCRHCGKNMRGNNKFCSGCGKEIIKK